MEGHKIILKDTSSGLSTFENAILVTSLDLNIWICLIFRIVLIRLSVKNPGPVNFMIAVDETAKMLALLPQTAIVLHGIQGKHLGTRFGPYCKYMFYCATVGTTAR